jgi:hypothetical protein
VETTLTDKEALKERMGEFLRESERRRQETIAAYRPEAEAEALAADRRDYEARQLRWFQGGRQGDKPRMGRDHQLELARKRRELPVAFNEALRDAALAEADYHEVRRREMLEEVEAIEDGLAGLLAEKERAERAYQEAEQRRVSLNYEEIRAGGLASQARSRARNISERLKSRRFFEET